MFVNVDIKKIRKDFLYDFKMPVSSTKFSAGLDLIACIEKQIIIKPNETISIPTGIAIQINQKNIAGFLFPRSGLSTKHGISLANSVGVIDPDYTGEIKCSMINNGCEEYSFMPNDRIAQIIFMPFYIAKFQLVENLDETQRGSGGFGSTGR